MAQLMVQVPDLPVRVSPQSTGINTNSAWSPRRVERFNALPARPRESGDPCLTHERLNSRAEDWVPSSAREDGRGRQTRQKLQCTRVYAANRLGACFSSLRR